MMLLLTFYSLFVLKVWQFNFCYLFLLSKQFIVHFIIFVNTQSYYISQINKENEQVLNEDPIQASYDHKYQYASINLNHQISENYKQKTLHFHHQEINDRNNMKSQWLIPNYYSINIQIHKEQFHKLMMLFHRQLLLFHILLHYEQYHNILHAIELKINQ